MDDAQSRPLVTDAGARAPGHTTGPWQAIASVPDNLWTSCQTYEFNMTDGEVTALAEKGVVVSDRKTRSLLWIDGHPLRDFRRARSVLAKLKQREGDR